MDTVLAELRAEAARHASPSGERESAIQVVAERLFAERGFAATRTADIAQAALFLASPYADYVTGETLSVNGGAMAGRAYLPLSTPRPR